MANSHGIGVKRRDYHRKNRKENKGHRWRGARTVPAIRLIKPTAQSPVITRTVYEDKGFYRSDFDEPIIDDREWFQIKSSLAPSHLLFYPPFLPYNEIRKRRFAEMEYKGRVVRMRGEMSDRWWEWEEEFGKLLRLECDSCGHIVWKKRKPKYCPECLVGNLAA